MIFNKNVTISPGSDKLAADTRIVPQKEMLHISYIHFNKSAFYLKYF